MPAEDVRVVLLEAAHAREAGQGAAELVAVQHAKVCQAHGQLAVRARAVPEHQAVPCMRLRTMRATGCGLAYLMPEPGAAL